MTIFGKITYWLLLALVIQYSYKFYGLCNIGWFRGQEITRLKKIPEDKLFYYVLSRIFFGTFTIIIVILYPIVILIKENIFKIIKDILMFMMFFQIQF